MALEIIGLGLTEEQLTLGAARRLASGARVVLRTGYCAAAAYLKARDIAFETLDALYEEIDDFDALAEALAEHVAKMAGDVLYGVLDLRDESVKRLLQKRPEAILLPGVPLEGALAAWALTPAKTFAASDLDLARIEAGEGALVREIASFALASEVKLSLMERYPEEQEVLFLREGTISRFPLEELDRQARYDHTACVFVPACRCLGKLERYGFEELKRVTAVLRGPNGCPWDREQTHEGLRPYVVEEAWEVSDAIERGDVDALCEELGDLLWQVCIHANVAEQYGEFTMDDITTGIAAKMIARHPHVFGNEDKGRLEEIWEEQKRLEKGLSSDADALRSVAEGLPALMRAQKVLGKLKKIGAALPQGPNEGLADEKALGKHLLSVCVAAKEQGLDAENALKKAIDALIDAFCAG